MNYFDAKRYKVFEKIHKKMTDKEKEVYFSLIHCGFHDYRKDGLHILMSSESIDKIIDYENKMIEKYLK
jgi:hypothetical protein